LWGRREEEKRKDGCWDTRVAPPLGLGLGGLTSGFPKTSWTWVPQNGWLGRLSSRKGENGN
jgi:hypothetical protein